MMEFILDMVHHNPGEKHFETQFVNPETLVKYGYNGKVDKHINCALNFRKFDPEVIPVDSEEDVWIQHLQEELDEEIADAKAKGLKMFFHIDLFVLPKRLVEKYHDELCGADGRLSLDAPLTLEVHKALFDELFERFPQVDGLIIRVGETYLYDTPYHMGNGPIRAAQYIGEDRAETQEMEYDRYVKLINFLRDEICVKHDRYLMFRTWDCFPDKFHAELEYYLAVTERIETHEKLIFSVKHTALDFWRRVRFNPCIGQGKHRQIIEVQCQREYEGKGAYPNYVMDGVIDGFKECENPKGLRSVLDNPLICGIYTWTRGGGWYGPYLENELWCSLHAWVIAGWAGDTEKSEESLFRSFWMEKHGMSEEDAGRMRVLCQTAADGILTGRYCEAFDKSLEERIMPTNLWMRDDRLGGMEQLTPVFKWLKEHDSLDAALEEKKHSVELWQKVVDIASQVQTGNVETLEYIRTSSEYGLRLYTVVCEAWKIWIQYTHGKTEWTAEEKKPYEAAWDSYRKVSELPQCATLYEGKYLNLPGTPEVAGMRDSMEEILMLR